MNVFPFWLKRPTPACTQYGPAGSEKTFVLKVMGALPLGHVLVEASTTRGHDEFAALGATLVPQLRARKVFIPDLIPQPDWDKYHFFYHFLCLPPLALVPVSHPPLTSTIPPGGRVSVVLGRGSVHNLL